MSCFCCISSNFIRYPKITIIFVFNCCNYDIFFLG